MCGSLLCALLPLLLVATSCCPWQKHGTPCSFPGPVDTLVLGEPPPQQRCGWTEATVQNFMLLVQHRGARFVATLSNVLSWSLQPELCWAPYRSVCANREFFDYSAVSQRNFCAEVSGWQLPSLDLLPPLHAASYSSPTEPWASCAAM